MVSFSTYGSWAGIVLIGAGYWYLQSSRTAARSNRPIPQKQTHKVGDARKDGKSKKQKADGPQSGGELGNSSQEKGQKKKKLKAAQPIVDDVPPAANITVDDKTGDDEINNQEFARQFQNAKSGSIPTSRPQASSRKKSVKQSHAKTIPTVKSTNGDDLSSNDVSKTPSTTGIDADDDLSAADSSPQKLTKTQPLRAGDVSDMLESPSAGPSVLRITAPANPPQPKERKPAQPPVPVETKKQRQHRKKAEAMKEARAEDEKARLVMLEKQRRTAREAEGRPAKDGSSFMASKTPSISAWTAPTAISNIPPGVEPQPIDLLDTYEPSANGVSQSKHPNNGAVSVKPKSSDWEKAIPSEEEQMRLLEEEMAWNTVVGKKGKKKAGDSDQVPETKLSVDENTNVSAKRVAMNKTNEIKKDPAPTEPVTIVGDSSIDMASFSHNGRPANAILENGDGQEYGFTMADDEWEVA